MSADIKVRFPEQLDKLKTRFASMQSRERMLVLFCAFLVVAAAVYLAAFMPLYKAVSDQKARISQKQQDLAWMKAMTGQLSALSSTQPAGSTNGESMVVLIANSATGSNVSAALTGQTPDGQNGVKVRLEGVNFDDLILWLGQLQKSYGIRIKDAELTKLPQPGHVDASISLGRNGG